jgi:2-succinyl-6-hydroxy-2,4-cyclohexadiene-1-carboxylate synthase
MSLSLCHTGNPHDPPIVFLHGFLGDKEDWEEIIHALCPSYFCVAFDLPGHGSSPNVSSDYLKVLQKEIAKAVSLPCCLIGYSLGGRLALQLAEEHPELYSHVIILSAHTGQTEEKQRALRLQSDWEWKDKLDRLTMEEFLKKWYAQPLFHSLRQKPDLLQAIIARRLLQDPRKMADALMTFSLARQNPIVSFHPRTLFLYGEHDEKCENLYRMLPKSISVRKIEQSGHIVHRENPKACVKNIQQWIKI